MFELLRFVVRNCHFGRFINSHITFLFANRMFTLFLLLHYNIIYLLCLFLHSFVCLNQFRWWLFFDLVSLAFAQNFAFLIFCGLLQFSNSNSLTNMVLIRLFSTYFILSFVLIFFIIKVITLFFNIFTFVVLHIFNDYNRILRSIIFVLLL